MTTLTSLLWRRHICLDISISVCVNTHITSYEIYTNAFRKHYKHKNLSYMLYTDVCAKSTDQDHRPDLVAHHVKVRSIDHALIANVFRECAKRKKQQK